MAASCSVLSKFPRNSFPLSVMILLIPTGKQPGCTAEEVLDDITVKRRYGQLQSVVAVFVDYGNDITAQLAHSELNSIHANELTDLYRAIVLWPAGLSGPFFNKQGFYSGSQSHRYHPHFILCRCDHPADSGDAQTG